MWRQYRPLLQGEFILAAGDCSQGGPDYNACQFFSKTNLDVPLVYHSRGVAAQMTRAVFPVLEKISDITGVRPIVAFETANGGASEMDSLNVLNMRNKFDLFKMPTIGKTDSADSSNSSKTLGYVTSGATRPILVSDLKDAIDKRVFSIYDKPTVKELLTFIEKSGKPQAESGAHDDLVLSLAIAWQMYQICSPPAESGNITHAKEAVSKIMSQLRSR